MNLQRVLLIEDPSQIAGARRSLQELLLPLGFGPAAAARAALAVTELGTNQLKHAGRGLLTLSALERGAAVGLELLALDRGPGIADVGASMRDGYSTAGSMGTGLGALQRASTALEIYTRPGQGTALRLELWNEPPPGVSPPTQLGALCVPMPGEQACGDAWHWIGSRMRDTLLVVDGLGHGPLAADAAAAAVGVLEAQPELTPRLLLEAIHGALGHTRGAAAAIVQLDHERGAGLFAGVGNICGCVVQSCGASRQLPSYSGTLGHKLTIVREFPFDFPEGSLLILHSDGVATRWDLTAYPGLLSSHPALIAGVLYRDFTRGRDDATAVVLRRRAR